VTWLTPFAGGISIRLVNWSVCGSSAGDDSRYWQQPCLNTASASPVTGAVRPIVVSSEIQESSHETSLFMQTNGGPIANALPQLIEFALGRRFPPRI